ncbi:MAG: Trp family transcriptional regulator [bacterium]
MPHVSRHEPEKKIADEIYVRLLDHLTNRGSAKDRSLVCAELFTRTEQIMLAKRLAIICMLGEGFSFDDIQETLRVSPSTVGRIWSAMQKGKFDQTIRIAKKNKVSTGLLAALAALVSAPRPVHAPRWNWVDRI